MDLAIIHDSIINIINGPSDRLSLSVSLSELSKAGDRLPVWLKSLPESLKWNAKIRPLPGPRIYALHMQFLTTTILLHRPFAAYMAKSRQSKAGQPVPQLTGYTPEASQRICSSSAVRIVKLLQSFRGAYGSDKIFSSTIYIAFTAALALISDIATAKQETLVLEETKWLKVCFEILSELGLALPVARRNLKILLSILDNSDCPELVFEVKTQFQNRLKGSPTSKVDTGFIAPSTSTDGNDAGLNRSSKSTYGSTRDFDVDPAVSDCSYNFLPSKHDYTSVVDPYFAGDAPPTNEFLFQKDRKSVV